MQVKKKSKIFFIVALVLALMSAAFIMTTLNIGGNEEDKVEVYINGTSIVYNGPMANEGLEKVKQLYTKDINRLVLNSPGGEINIGMSLGEWVYDKGLDVEIKNIAFSSAANYVFTAGKNKYLHTNSMVGWHGGATQENNSFFMNLFMRKYLKESKNRETEYFKKIGVEQKSTVYGQRPEFDNYSEKNNYVGWTYSLAAMKQLGIKNIILIDGEWLPAKDYNGKKIFTINEINP